MNIIPLTKRGRKKQGLDYYMKKAFLPEDFEDFVLFNFMRTDMYQGRIIKGKYVEITRPKLLDKKLREQKIQNSESKSWVFFTAIPTKFFKKYFSEKLIENYKDDEKDVFICLDSKVLFNIPKNYWIAIFVFFIAVPYFLQHSYFAFRYQRVRVNSFAGGPVINGRNAKILGIVFLV